VVKDGKTSPREPKRFRVPDELLDMVKKRVVKGIRDETKKFKKKQVPRKDYDFEESGKEWSKKVMQFLWVKWAETYVKPEEKDEENKIKAKLLQKDFEDAQFWWGNAPVTNLMRLNTKQSDGWMCGLNIADRQIKKKMLECNLPRTAIFNGLALHAAIQPYFTFLGDESESDDEDDEDELALTPVIVQKWYNLGGARWQGTVEHGQEQVTTASLRDGLQQAMHAGQEWGDEEGA
jgi:transketolase